MKKFITILALTLAIKASGAGLTAPFALQVNPTNFIPVAPVNFWYSNAPTILSVLRLYGLGTAGLSNATAFQPNGALTNNETRQIDLLARLRIQNGTNLTVLDGTNMTLPGAATVIGAGNFGPDTNVVLHTDGGIEMFKAGVGRFLMNFSTLNTISMTGAGALVCDSTTISFVSALLTAKSFYGNAVGLTNADPAVIFPSSLRTGTGRVVLENSPVITTPTFITQITSPKNVFSGNLFDSTGAGSPEGVVTAAVGSTYRRTDGGASTSLYIKESGSGNTGWVAYGAAGAGSVDDTAFASSWNAVTTIAPSKNAVYDWIHSFDTDDDGKVNVLDVGAGVVETDSSGNVSVTTPTGSGVAVKATSPIFSTQITTPKIVYTGSVIELTGSGSPEGVVTAAVGSIYHRTDGGASTSVYVKESGASNTGWVAYGAPSGASVDDTAFASSWNGVTTIAPSKNAVYDWIHTFDTDDDGKVNVLDMGAGIVKTDSGGVVSAAVAGTDYYAPGSTDVAIADGGTGASTAAAALDNLITAEASVASATTTDLGAQTSQNLNITGTTTITGFGTIGAGVRRHLKFAGALTLTHNASSLILPNAGANIATAAGDTAQALSLGSGNWRVERYARADGTALAGGSSTNAISNTNGVGIGSGNYALILKSSLLDTNSNGNWVKITNAVVSGGPTNTSTPNFIIDGASGGQTNTGTIQAGNFVAIAAGSDKTGKLILSESNATSVVTVQAPRTLTTNRTQTLQDLDGIVALQSDVTNAINDTAFASSWNGVTTIAPSKNAVYDWIHTFDTDDDGKVNVLDMGAGIVKTDSGGAVSAATAGTDYTSPTSTETFQNKTFDASGTGNTLKLKSYIYLTGFHNCTGAIPQNTNDYTANTFMKPVFLNGTATNANFIEFQIQVPDDFDTSIDPKIRITDKLTGADTGVRRYVVTMASVANSAAYAGTVATGINVDIAADASGASGDVEQSSLVTLTGWGAAVTPGRHWVIRIARDGNSATDTSTVDSMFSLAAIEYGVTQ